MSCPQVRSGQNILVLQNPFPLSWPLGGGLGKQDLDKSSSASKENGAWGGYRNEVSFSKSVGIGRALNARWQDLVFLKHHL